MPKPPPPRDSKLKSKPRQRMLSVRGPTKYQCPECGAIHWYIPRDGCQRCRSKAELKKIT